MQLPTFNISHLTSDQDSANQLPLVTDVIPTPPDDDEPPQQQIIQIEHTPDTPIPLEQLQVEDTPSLPRRSTREVRPVDRYVPNSNLAFWAEDCFIAKGDVCAYAFATEATV
jgi:hypothetical protein